MVFQIPPETERCYYCGELATSVDHVIPRVMIDRLKATEDRWIKKVLYDKHKIKVVQSCHECNCVLGSKYFETLEKRKNYIKQRLRQRYKKILNIPNWEDWELAEMGPIMQIHINQGLKKKDRITARLGWIRRLKMAQIVKCEECEEEYEQKRKWQRFCSPRCRWIYFDKTNPRMRVHENK